MTDKKLSTDSYKGVRDFYPEDASIQQYIFNTWSKTAESFGYERYDASILEPSDLYRAKGAENEEMVNEQTYSFTDRGDREVTLRPEMTPTVARMVAGKARELAFPLRWYSIPNLFRYERPQKGRLREHWQLNCDIFGSDEIAADVEIIALAYQTLIDFGAKPEQFEIRINHRSFLDEHLRTGAEKHKVELNNDKIVEVSRIIDKRNKISSDEFDAQMINVLGSTDLFEYLQEAMRQDINQEMLHESDASLNLRSIIVGLQELGITNAKFDQSIMRGFDYYTGTIFEIFELDDEGKSTGRSMLGGGRYDNLTSMFGGVPISGVGFGMGDVTMRDFLEAHDLIPDSVRSTSATVSIIPETAKQNIFAQSIAKNIRQAGFSVSTDIGTQKADKKKARATERGTKFIIVIGLDEVKDNKLSVKNLSTGEETTLNQTELTNWFKSQ